MKLYCIVDYCMFCLTTVKLSFSKYCTVSQDSTFVLKVVNQSEPNIPHVPHIEFLPHNNLWYKNTLFNVLNCAGGHFTNKVKNHSCNSQMLSQLKIVVSIILHVCVNTGLCWRCNKCSKLKIMNELWGATSAWFYYKCNVTCQKPDPAWRRQVKGGNLQFKQYQRWRPTTVMVKS